MSIIIRNIGGNMLGECEYELRINERVICTFKHNRPDGLTKCLELAAKAHEKAKWLQAADILQDLQDLRKK